jgi:hypothetical protein
MFASGPQCGFLPLGTEDVEAGDVDTQEILGEDQVTQSQWSDGPTECAFYRPLYVLPLLARIFPKFLASSIWTICSATALITTKRLMFTHGYRKSPSAYQLTSSNLWQIIVR